MPVSFEQLKIGQKYDRPFLAKLWGYRGFQAISRGVVTPAGSNFIILFVTKHKQEALTQYHDYIEGNRLHWEGEEKHTSDSRVINAKQNGDEIHLFYRDIHHTPFVYYGKIHLETYRLLTDSPSKFIFTIADAVNTPDEIDDIEQHKAEFIKLDKTEQESVVKSRIGQGVFRERLIELWGGCSVTGLENLSLLRASHIKPWRDSTNQERLDPLNGLLLHPTLDHLFDIGLITFEDDGYMRISEVLSDKEKKLLHISTTNSLRKIPNGLMKYMRYHRKNVYRNG